MQTRLLYNYKNGDMELASQISALQLKLNLGENENLENKIASAVSNALATEEAVRETTDRALTDRLDLMETEIDGAISTWFEEGEPTLENEPAVNWEEESDLAKHLGDLYYDTETGFCYRFQRGESEYEWQLIKDTDVTKALSDAAQALTDAASAQAAADAAVKKDQGAASAGHALMVNAAGQVTTELPNKLLLTSEDGMHVFAIGIGEGGALTVSEVILNGGE